MAAEAHDLVLSSTDGALTSCNSALQRIPLHTPITHIELPQQEGHRRWTHWGAHNFLERQSGFYGP